MISVIYAPKGGTGKTSIIKQLAFYLPKNTTYLDLDFNEGLLHLIDINQPKPKQISEKFISELLPRFIESKQLLLIDCSGYPTSHVLNAIAQADNVIIPITKGKTLQKTVDKSIEILEEISKQINFTLKGKILWNRTAWNTSIKNRNSSLPVSKYIEPLSFGVVQHNDIADCIKSDNKRVIKSMKLLAKEITK